MKIKFLDNPQTFKKYDPRLVGRSIELLPDQMREILNMARVVKVPREYSKIKNIVVAGMGGSSLGAHFIKAALSDVLKYPIIINSGYQVPNFVNSETLYILSSYSGTTEEPLGTYREAKKRKAKIMGITEDGGKNNKLKKLMLKDDLPGMIFDAHAYNPSGQPRMALGYAILSTLVLLGKSGALKIEVSELEKIISRLELNTRRLRPSKEDNPAKILAEHCLNRLPVLIAGEHLIGNLQILRNQLNENSKNMASMLELPDHHHYALEGFTFPKGNQKNLQLILFQSALYHPRNRKRLVLTKKIAGKNKLASQEVKLKEKTRLGQAFEMLQLGSWLSYYLAMLNRINPAPIPYVDWLKEQLKK